MIREHLETRIEMPNMCPFEKKEKEVFFRLTTFFFQEQKRGTGFSDMDAGHLTLFGFQIT